MVPGCIPCTQPPVRALAAEGQSLKGPCLELRDPCTVTHTFLNPQVRFSRHVVLLVAAEAPAALLALLASPASGAGAVTARVAVLRWAAALVAAPAAAVWLAERGARAEFATAQRMGVPGVSAPAPPGDAFFCPQVTGATDSAAVLAKMAAAQASPFDAGAPAGARAWT